MHGPSHDDDVAPVLVPYRPASHAPLHAALDSAVVFPKRPAGHGAHAAAPPALYVPTAHGTAESLTEPAGHAYPGAHGPLQSSVVTPVALPYLPAGHTSVHNGVVMPAVVPYRPSEQRLQVLPPPTLNCPGGHNDGVEFVDPGGHANPGLHCPLHAAVVMPSEEPNVPPGHGPLQLEFVSPDALP